MVRNDQKFQKLTSSPWHVKNPWLSNDLVKDSWHGAACMAGLNNFCHTSAPVDKLHPLIKLSEPGEIKILLLKTSHFNLW